MGFQLRFSWGWQEQVYKRGLEIVMSVASQRIGPDWMEAESVPLLNASSRILRETVLCDVDSPPFDKAIRDGFAVRYEDVQSVPMSLKIVGESRAGMGAVSLDALVRGYERLDLGDASADLAPG